MCGIAGWLLPEGSQWRPDKELLGFWIKSMEARGKDACGYFTLTDEETPRRFWMKGPVTPERFAEDWIKREATPVGRIGFLHNRSWTVGPPSVNENNHPLIVRKTVVVHNGGFSNIEAVYKALNVTKPIAVVDSAVLPHAIDALGINDGLKLIQEKTPGLATFAAFLPNGDVAIGKDGRSLYLSGLPDGGFMFASEAETCFATHDFQADQGIVFDTMRFPMLKYMVFDGSTVRLKHVGKFKLDTPVYTNARHASGMGMMGFSGTRGATFTKNICAWGRCTEVGVKTVQDVDGKQKLVCRPHKKQWVRGVALPTWTEDVPKKD